MIPVVDIDQLVAAVHAGAPMLLHISASFCVYDLILVPRVQWLQVYLQGKAAVVQIKVERNEQQVPKLGIRGIPALAFFAGGELVRCWYGADIEPDVVGQFINQYQQKKEVDPCLLP